MAKWSHRNKKGLSVWGCFNGIKDAPFVLAQFVKLMVSTVLECQCDCEIRVECAKEREVAGGSERGGKGAIYIIGPSVLSFLDHLHVLYVHVFVTSYCNVLSFSHRLNVLSVHVFIICYCYGSSIIFTLSLRLVCTCICNVLLQHSIIIFFRPFLRLRGTCIYNVLLQRSIIFRRKVTPWRSSCRQQASS